MKLVTFNDFNGQEEVTVNCDNITYVEPNVLDEGTTVIYFTGKQLLTVKEDYEEVKRRIKE